MEKYSCNFWSNGSFSLLSTVALRRFMLGVDYEIIDCSQQRANDQVSYRHLSDNMMMAFIMLIFTWCICGRCLLLTFFRAFAWLLRRQGRAAEVERPWGQGLVHEQVQPVKNVFSLYLVVHGINENLEHGLVEQPLVQIANAVDSFERFISLQTVIDIQGLERGQLLCRSEYIYPVRLKNKASGWISSANFMQSADMSCSP